MPGLNSHQTLQQQSWNGKSLLDKKWADAPSAWWLATLAALMLGLWLTTEGDGSLVAGVIVFTLLLVATLMNKAVAIPLILAFLFLMGDIRRIIGLAVGFPQLDPLLLVGPGITFVLVFPLLIRLRLPDLLTRMLLGLMLVMILQVFNPKQGSLFVGFTGAMFYLVPLLWFWIGREYGSLRLLQLVIYRLLIPLSLLAAAMGLYQAYIGFLPWQAAWVAAVSGHYRALFLASGVIRSFGFSVNGIEYTNLLLIGSVATVSAFFGRRRVYILLSPPLSVALFLSSSRTSVVKLLFAVAMIWALSSKGGRGWIFRLAFALLVGVGALTYSLSQLVPDEPSSNIVVVRSKDKASAGSEPDAVTASTQHQLQGLAHPLDKKYSTAQGHSTLFLGGLMQGLRDPIGSGLGSVTLGAGKFGSGDEDAAGSTEIDISDMFVATGLVGGALYLLIIILIIRQCIAFSRVVPKEIGLPVAGILAALLGGWIASGQYALGPLVWLIIGVISNYNLKNKFLSRKARMRVRVPL